MNDSELIPELEILVSEYTSADDYKKLMIYNTLIKDLDLNLFLIFQLIL